MFFYALKKCSTANIAYCNKEQYPVYVYNVYTSVYKINIQVFP